VGYAAKFGVLSLDLGDFVERIDPGAFGLVAERRGRRKPLETRALWNHDPNYPLARYPGTLRMTVDEVGLRYEFPVPDTSYGRDIASNIRAGIVKGSSFSFTVPSGGDSWAVEDGRSVRTIQKIDTLLDVGPVTFPAYPDADVKVAQRSFDQYLQRQAYIVARHTKTIGRINEIREYLRQHGR
jgi:HK97 family phage prohead protease